MPFSDGNAIAGKGGSLLHFQNCWEWIYYVIRRMLLLAKDHLPRWNCQCNGPYFSFFGALKYEDIFGCNPRPLLVSCTLLPSLSQMKAINIFWGAVEETRGWNAPLGSTPCQTLPKAWMNQFCSKSNPWADKPHSENRLSSSSEVLCYTLSF